MSETHYIEIDEEIISAVSRLRKSNTPENVFVFPKRSLILQSIINLKLLSREAEKLGKTVIVMTQDEQGMRLAEKAGMRVQAYQDAALRQQRQDAAARFTVRHGESIPMPEPSGARSDVRRASEIGSENFYATTASPSSDSPQQSPVSIAQASTPTAPPASVMPKTLRIRNMTPPLQTTLNSQRAESISAPVPAPRSRTNNGHDRTSVQPTQRLRHRFEDRSEHAQFATGVGSPNPTAFTSVPDNAQSTANRLVKTTKKNRSWSWVPLSVGVVLCAGIVALGYFFLRPTAMVTIEAQSAVQTVKRSLVGAVEGTSDTVVRYIEEEKTIRLSRPTTGSDVMKEAKASGVITISNAFGEAAQSLVATTRFETPDGKIYRLREGVTVPGMKQEGSEMVPGKIDARVIADGVGTRYNITSGSFVIPGFKGGPKFEKITAVVKTSIIGGGEAGSATARQVSSSDLEAAQTAAADEAKRAVLQDAAGSLSAGEAVLEPSFQVSVLGTPVTSALETTTTTFDYEARFQVRGFVITEAAIRTMIDAETTESGGITLRPSEYTLSYGSVLPDFSAKRVDLTVESKVQFRAPLDMAVLKAELLGLDEAGIRAFLSKHPEIKRLQVEFKPRVFVATIPNNADRVTVQLLDPEQE